MELEDVRFRDTDFDVHGFVERVARFAATRPLATGDDSDVDGAAEGASASWLALPAALAGHSPDNEGTAEEADTQPQPAPAERRASERQRGSGEAARMLKAFRDTSAELWILHDQVEKDLSSLEVSCRSQEERHLEALKSSQFLENGFHHLRQLGHDLTSVESKILTIKLEGVKARRDRLMEATNLVKHFAAFSRVDGRLLPPLHKFEESHGDHTPEDEDEMDPDAHSDDGEDEEAAAAHSHIFVAELELAASVMQRLQSLVSELPQDQHENARTRITAVHDAVEAALLVNFRASILTDKAKTIKQSVDRINAFSAKLYATAVRIFVEQFIERKFNNLAADVFSVVDDTCSKAAKLVHKVFPSPDSVVQTFVATIFRTALKDYIETQLSENPDTALELLHELFLRTQTLARTLNDDMQLGMDSTTQLKFVRSIFSAHLDVYIETELSSLTQSYERLLNEFYDEIVPISGDRSTSSQLPTMIRRGPGRSKSSDVQVIASNTLLREDLAIQMLVDNRRAIERCRSLALPGKSPEWAFRLFTQLLEGLCNEHIGFALACAIKALPSRKPKTAPDIAFFHVIKDANSLFYLLQETVTPAVRESLSLYPACLERKNTVMQQLEKQLAGGLNHAMDAIEEWVKHVLAKEQQKTDFRPDEGGMLSASCTPACAKVTAFLKEQIAVIKACLNGKNLTLVLRELGTRVHRVLLEHIRSHTFSDLGGIKLTCDLKEYERVFTNLSDAFVSELMDTLKELSRLLVVMSDSIPQLVSEGRLVLLDKAVVQSFLNLRSDHKSGKFSNLFRT